MNIRLVGPKLSLADGRVGSQAGAQTDRHDEANNRLLQFRGCL